MAEFVGLGNVAEEGITPDDLYGNPTWLDKNPEQKMWWHVIIRGIEDAVGKTYPENIHRATKQEARSRVQKEGLDFIFSKELDILVDLCGFPYSADKIRSVVSEIVEDCHYTSDKGKGKRRRGRITVWHKGQPWTLREIADATGLNQSTVYGRWNRSWPSHKLFEGQNSG